VFGYSGKLSQTTQVEFSVRYVQPVLPLDLLLEALTLSVFAPTAFCIGSYKQAGRS